MPQTMNEVLHPTLEWERDSAFPSAPEFWTREAGEQQASQEGLQLTDDHWEMVRSLHQFYRNHPRPNPRELQDALGERFHANGGLKFLYTLFPGGPLEQGCRIAGLEPPGAVV